LGSGRISGNPERNFKENIGLKFPGKRGKFKYSIIRIIELI
jgi:hypothetical protein